MKVPLQNLKLTRSLAALDVETTGTNARADRIVEVAVLIAQPDGTVFPCHRRVNPGRPIPSAATGMHGIRDADVVAASPFACHRP